MANRFNLDMHDYIHRPEGKLVFNKRLFSHIASKYDFVNRILSFGRDTSWKKRLVEDLPEAQAPYCLDIACGTGDITFRLAAKYPSGRIVGLDLTEPMVDLARTRNTFANITFAIGDMCRISYADESFDIVTGGYALRNAPNLEQALLEIRRVMKPGATAAILDLSKSPNWFLQTAQDFLLRFWGGFWGILLHRNPQLYTYIAASLRQFPDSTTLKQLIAKLGFTNIRSRKHFLGFTETIIFQKP
ncbi:MAG: ubiquinone/menaquinone biosynthesis methyltransferase [Sedimentisphaerales bacterium]|jgi:demethylmenaquinone methyltransferase/2-methoxy-6-polyprenyl-1,4-benzoquinol methylase